MLGNIFRPWGHFYWLSEKLHTNSWDFFGCLATEQRCLGTLEILRNKSALRKAKMVKIVDPPSRFSQLADSMLSVSRNEYFALGGSINDIDEIELLATHQIIVDQIDNFIACSSGDIILDISSFPKRFFFPIVKRLILSQLVNNLVITYTVPREYSNEALSEDHKANKALPLFGPQFSPGEKHEIAIVGIGFMPLGLPDILEGLSSDMPIKLLFPFPPGPPGFQRSSDLVRKLEKILPHDDSRCPIYIDVLNVSTCFDHICFLTDKGDKKAIFAPYGPKTMSLSMSIYATQTNSTVVYTQPEVYNPNYCIGIKRNNGVPETYGYCVKLNNKNYYTLN